MATMYKTKEEVLEKAKTILSKTFRQLISAETAKAIEDQSRVYGANRKGFLGDSIEKYFFEINPGNVSRPDFTAAGVELKVTPLKKVRENKLVSKERLVFSMINYDSIVGENWNESTFLKKNKLLLLMFYLWIGDINILDYEFKFVHLLNLIDDISREDTFQIQKDWEYIVSKIKRGEAHLLSEADTYFLGACTKAANSQVSREQPMNRIPAKPRAFAFKQQYINYLIQTRFFGQRANTDSIFKKLRRIETIEDVIREKFSHFLGQTDREILNKLGYALTTTPKNYKRLIVNRILGVTSNKIEELEKANITLRVVTLEHTGKLKESISFPAFDYKELVAQLWENDLDETMADFHLQLETKKFLFVIFQKQKNSNDIILKKIVFWNFPMKDLPEAERVWQKTIDCISVGEYGDLPKIRDSKVAHVRPHGKNSLDTLETPQGTQEIKRCFWLNAKYIEQAINAS